MINGPSAGPEGHRHPSEGLLITGLGRVPTVAIDLDALDRPGRPVSAVARY